MLFFRSMSFAIGLLAAVDSCPGWQNTLHRTPTPLPTTDTVTPSVRAARDNLYASLVRNLPSMTTESPNLPPRVTAVHRTPLPELPVNRAQTIVIGQVVGLTPHAIAQYKGLYTEYHVTTSSTLMNTTDWQGSTLDFLEIGGVAQDPGGRVLEHHATGFGNQIEVGKEYLMFLKYRPEAQCFTIVKLWELSQGKAVATSSDDIARTGNNLSTVNGMPVSAVVNQVQSLIAAKQ